MALVLGTNCGFVTEAPTADPNDNSSTWVLDNYKIAMKVTAPAGATSISEIGWWSDNATQEANFDVGLYSHDAENDRPGELLASSGDVAKGTTAGWKHAAVSCAITAGTTYWIAAALDDTATGTYMELGLYDVDRTYYKDLGTPLPDPWGTGGGYASYRSGFYAVYQTGGTNHSLTANGLTLGTPSLGGPALGQVHVLSASGLMLGAAVLGSPSLSQIHGLVAQGLALGAPSLGSPGLSQDHLLQAQGLDFGAPVLGSPSINQVHVLAAVGLLAGAPILDSPGLTQNHVLAALALLMGAPALGTPDLWGANHELLAQDLTIGTPELGAPLISQNHVLEALEILFGAPVLGAPAIAQDHQLAALSLLLGAPVLGAPALNPPPPAVVQMIPGLKASLEMRLRRMVHYRDPAYLYRGPRDLIDRIRKLNK